MNSLARIMAERDLRHGQVARMSGVARETICKVAGGRIKITKAPNVAALAWALNVRPETFADIYAGDHVPVGGAIGPSEDAKNLLRTCFCGTHLSKSNPGRECAICERVRLDAEVLDDVRAKQVYEMRKVLGIYTRPHLYDSPAEFLKALTAAMDGMARTAGKPLVDFPWGVA